MICRSRRISLNPTSPSPKPLEPVDSSSCANVRIEQPTPRCDFTVTSRALTRFH